MLKIAQQSRHKIPALCAKQRYFAFWTNFFRKHPEICQKMSVVSGKRVYPFGKKSFFGVDDIEKLAKSKKLR